jgi:Na+/H+-dicarboxylate symporter
VKIYTKILIGLVTGAILGVILSLTGSGSWGGYLKPVGDAFINLIKMVVIPLVMASIILGTASLGDFRKLGRIGLKTLLFYGLATAVAVICGLTAANFFRPGGSVDAAKREAIMGQVLSDPSYRAAVENAERYGQQGQNVGDILLGLIPTNPIKSMADGNMLQVITFSILLGIALTLIAAGPRQAVLSVLEGINDAMVVMVKMIMSLAPYGVFAIIAAVVAQLGFEFLISLLNYALITLAVMAFFYVVFYGIVIRLFGGMSPLKFFRELRPVGLLAFSTASSNATLPENMEVCREKLGVPAEVVSFTLPLGATVNMNGTAIYQGISVMFIAQVFGIELTLAQQAMVVLTASLASVGTAGVPGIGMVTLAMVLSSVGLPTAGIALVLGVERILDMARTVLNVTGDAAGAVIVGNSEGGNKPAANDKK